MYGIIYRVTNTVNGKTYIGQTKTPLGKRWSKHCSDARAGAGWVLAAAIRKYGKEAFTVDVVEECADKEALNAAEIAWISKLQPVYNACAGGGGLGAPSPEVRAKISLAIRGAKRSEQTRRNMSAAQKGHPVAEETKQKIHDLCEKTRISIRKARQEGRKEIKKENGTEQDEKEIQALTDEFIKKVDTLMKQKEKELDSL